MAFLSAASGAFGNRDCGQQLVGELEQLLDELVGEGQWQSQGRFSLDAHKAREKLAQRQLREAGLWLTKLVQWGHQWEARRIRLRQRRECTEVELELAQSHDLMAWIRRLHNIELLAHPHLGALATAFQAALADGCEHVEVLPEGHLLTTEDYQGPPLEPRQQVMLRFHYARQSNWWNPWQSLRPPRRALENFLATSRRAALALPSLEIDGYRPSSEAFFQAPDTPVLERVWLSRSRPRQLMLYQMGPNTAEEINLKLSHSGDPAGFCLRQWRGDHPCHWESPESDLPRWYDRLASQARLTPPPTQQSGLAVRGVLRWHLNGEEPAAIIPVKDGIALDSIPYPSLPQGVQVWLSSSAWRTDLNFRKTLSDEIRQQMCLWCSQEFDAALAELRDLLAHTSGFAPLRLGLARWADRRSPILPERSFPSL